MSPRDVAILDLSGSLGETFGRTRPKVRYNARLCERRGVQVAEGTLRDLPAFYGRWAS